MKFTIEEREVVTGVIEKGQQEIQQSPRANNNIVILSLILFIIIVILIYLQEVYQKEFLKK